MTISDLPEGWQRIPLGEIADQVKDTVMPDSNKMTYVGLEHMESGKNSINSHGSSDEVRSMKFKFRKGDVLYGKLRPYLDKAALSHFEGICSTDIIVLRPRNSVLPYFLVNLLHLKDFREYSTSRSTGVNHPRTSWSSVSQYEIPLPPKEEQNRIAFVLSKIQKAIDLQQQILTSCQDLKQSLLLHVFSAGLRDGERKQTEVGEIPKHWMVNELGEIADFKNGINFEIGAKGKGVLTVDVLNMYGNDAKVDMSELYRVENGASRNEDYSLRPGDILFVRSSLKREGVGWASLFEGWKEPVTFCGFIIRARLRTKEISPRFLTYYLRSPTARNQLISGSAKVAITNINQGLLKTLNVPCPPPKEQANIEEIFSTLDSKIAFEQARKEKLARLFDALLPDLMAGEIRTSDLEVAMNA